MKMIRMRSRVIVHEPGQPERRGVITDIVVLDDDRLVYDIICDDGKTKLLAMPAEYLSRE